MGWTFVGLESISLVILSEHWVYMGLTSHSESVFSGSEPNHCRTLSLQDITETSGTFYMLLWQTPSKSKKIWLFCISITWHLSMHAAPWPTLEHMQLLTCAPSSQFGCDAEKLTLVPLRPTLAQGNTHSRKVGVTPLNRKDIWFITPQWELVHYGYTTSDWITLPKWGKRPTTIKQGMPIGFHKFWHVPVINFIMYIVCACNVPIMVASTQSLRKLELLVSGWNKHFHSSLKYGLFYWQWGWTNYRMWLPK